MPLNHLQYLPLAFYEQTHTSSLSHLIQRELEIAKDFLVGDLQKYITLPVSFVFVTFYLFNVHPILGGIALSIGPLQLASNLLWRSKFQLAVQQKTEVIRDLFFHIEETLTGIREIKTNQMEPSIDRRMREIQHQGVATIVRCTQIDTIRGLFRSLPREVGYGAGIAVGSVMVARGIIGVGGIIAFITLLDRVSGTFTGLVGLLSNREATAIGTHYLMEVMQLKSESQQEGLLLDCCPASITFRNVTFGYEPGSLELKDLSFHLPAGSSLALVGPSGSGKTTLVKMLYRFYEPQAGSIEINNVPIADLSLASMRGQMALVSQDIFLFDATIAENIAAGRQGASQDEIVNAAILAQAYDFIMQTPKGFETKIGQRGVTLSHGQKQRLSIARAILRDASILIMDEPTASLDVETEASFMRDLGHWSERRTRIIIAHRLSTIRDVDYILFLEEGRVLECGPPNQLLLQKGRFWDYCEQQGVSSSVS